MGTKDLLKKTSYHTLSSSETLEALETSPSGLTKEEARSRLSFYGGNVLEEGAKRTLIGMFGEQFKNPMIIVLLGAALIAGFLGEITDAIIILVVVLLNAVLGVAQESKAEKALAALKSISSPLAKVKREGQIELIKASEIVPGDIIALEAGDYVPADLRLLETHNLKIEEAALTGESVPAEKQPATLEEEDLALGDRSNMAYLGSSVVYGRGTGVAIATGMETEIGKIAGYLTAEDPNTTPLQKKLAELSKYLTAAVILICGLIFVTGLLRGNAAFDIFLTSVSLAVAAIPEGLPAVITIVLALGVQRMARRKAIIRRLPAVETLGSTQIICSDKTGTLTQNKMTVKQLYFNDLLLTEKEAGLEIPGMEEFLKALVLCNDSKINFEKGELNVLGDPTETALIYFALAKDFAKDSLEKEHPRIDEVPFDSDRKLMTTINKFPNSFKALTKGAPDVLLTRCSSILLDGKIRSLTPQIMHKIEEANRKMASKALRVLAVACKELDSYSPVSSSAESQGQGFKEQDLVFLGLVGMIDPPREEAKEAVRICQKAGIKPIMITGDHPETAAAIARELNIINNPSEVITGRELDKMKEEEEFKDSITKYSVYARVSPENKVQIVKAWKEKGKVVAMTGDGVNDAPALKYADIGVGMGITGTDVAKGVSDMVLADDNFATIVIAVEEGRKIYNNIRKVIQFLLSCNLSEIVALLIATLLNWRILFPIHILWINLVTDSFPALALGLEKAEKNIMDQKPRSEQNVFAGGLALNILYQGIIMGLLTLLVFILARHRYHDPEVSITMAFATLGLIQLIHAFNARSLSHSLFSLGFFSNPYLWGAFLISLTLQVSVITLPFLNRVFRVVPLNLEQWGIVIVASLSIIPIVEIVKYIKRFPKQN